MSAVMNTVLPERDRPVTPSRSVGETTPANSSPMPWLSLSEAASAGRRQTLWRDKGGEGTLARLDGAPRLVREIDDRQGSGGEFALHRRHERGIAGAGQ